MTERTVMRKIQAKLPENERLHKMRRKSHWYDKCGPYYILDAEFNMFVAWASTTSKSCIKKFAADHHQCEATQAASC